MKSAIGSLKTLDITLLLEQVFVGCRCEANRRDKPASRLSDGRFTAGISSCSRPFGA